ncbi:MAG: hypothetical protein ACOC2F_02605 [Bacteroidota bacterium]
MSNKRLDSSMTNQPNNRYKIPGTNIIVEEVSNEELDNLWKDLNFII